MKLKKILSLTMALAMVLALAIPAMAASSNTTQTITVGGANKTGAISVTLNTPGNIVLNPYHMEATSGTDKSYHQIFFVPVKVQNNSDFGLKVNASVKGEVEGAATLVNAVPKDTATAKEVFLYAEFGTTLKDVQPEWATEYNKSNANQVQITTTASTAKTVATLPAASSSVANYLWYKFDGAAAKSPTEQWAADDKVKAEVTLTLIPTVDEVYKVNVVNTTSKTAGGTVSLNYDLAPAKKEIQVTCTPDAALTGSTPTVTATQGSTKLTIDDDDAPVYKFEMPAGEVTVTVKWTAGS
jgi:hypothetical protein